MTTIGDLKLFADEGAKFYAPIVYYRWDVEEEFEVSLTDEQWDALVDKLEMTHLDTPHRLYADVITAFLGEVKPKKLGEWQSVDVWEAEYHPYENWLVDNPSWTSGDNQGCLFETFGVEAEFVAKQDERHVWSYVDADNGGTQLVTGCVTWTVPIGYLVTAKPWKSGHEFVVVS